MEEKNSIVDIGEGVLLPIEKHEGPPNKCVVLMAHGLGHSQNNDRAVPTVCNAARAAKFGAVSYDARGHGKSSGWQKNAANLSQFSWFALAEDQRLIAQHLGLSHWIAAGNSMGAATALWAAVRFPEKIRALILVRPPTCWEERKARKQTLIDKAEKLNTNKESPPPMYHVLRGAAEADFPSLAQIQQISCPTLILATEGDPVHPLSSATMLEQAIKGSKLLVCSDEKIWSGAITAFLGTMPA